MSRFNTSMLLTIINLSVSFVAAISSDILVRELVYVVEKGDEIDVELKGYSKPYRKIEFRLLGLPKSGKVAHPEVNYCNYRFPPKQTDPIENFTDDSATISCPSTSLIYSPNENSVAPTEEPHDCFQYQAFDQTNVTSYPSRVCFLNSNRILVASFFRRSSDKWEVVHEVVNQKSEAAKWNSYSRGQMSGFIIAEEGEINLDSTGNDMTKWYFKAPPKFSGDRVAAYGGELRFTLGSAAGDFTKKLENDSFVMLECENCNISNNKGIRLHYPTSKLTSHFDGSTKEIVIPLVESEWLKDSENTQVSWTPPSPCEMVQVLKRLSGLYILGDHTNGYESIALDGVQIIAGKATIVPIPLACYEELYYSDG